MEVVDRQQLDVDGSGAASSVGLAADTAAGMTSASDDERGGGGIRRREGARGGHGERHELDPPTHWSLVSGVPVAGQA